MKKIGILIDRFTSHLFHDIELIICCMGEMKKNGYSRDEYEVGYIKNMFMNEVIFSENQKWLHKTLFGCELKVYDPNVEKVDVVIERAKLNTRNINKASADYVYSFPLDMWCNKLSIPLNNEIGKLKILYSARQNSQRQLTQHSHRLLCDIVNSTGGTIVDDFSNISLKDQVEIFKSHNCLIGVHGNNLTGLMWMKPGSYVFEILPTVLKNHVYDYHILSDTTNKRYHQIDCDSNTGALSGVYHINSSGYYYLKNTIEMLKNIMH